MLAGGSFGFGLAGTRPMAPPSQGVQAPRHGALRKPRATAHGGRPCGGSPQDLVRPRNQSSDLSIALRLSYCWTNRNPLQGWGGGGIAVWGGGGVEYNCKKLRVKCRKLWESCGKLWENCDTVSNFPRPSRCNRSGQVAQIFSFGHTKGPRVTPNVTHRWCF